MKYKTYLTQLKKRFLKKERVVADPQLMHPEREWAVGLFVAVIIFALCGYLSVLTYIKNRSVSAIPIQEDAEQTVYRESIVKEALSEVKNRERELRTLTESGVTETAVADVASTTPGVVVSETPKEEAPATSTTPTLGD